MNLNLKINCPPWHKAPEGTTHAEYLEDDDTYHWYQLRGTKIYFRSGINLDYWEGFEDREGLRYIQKHKLVQRLIHMEGELYKKLKKGNVWKSLACCAEEITLEGVTNMIRIDSSQQVVYKPNSSHVADYAIFSIPLYEFLEDATHVSYPEGSS